MNVMDPRSTIPAERVGERVALRAWEFETRELPAHQLEIFFLEPRGQTEGAT